MRERVPNPIPKSNTVSDSEKFASAYSIPAKERP
jgi:hypothetical protein